MTNTKNIEGIVQNSFVARTLIDKRVYTYIQLSERIFAIRDCSLRIDPGENILLTLGEDEFGFYVRKAEIKMSNDKYRIIYSDDAIQACNETITLSISLQRQYHD
ncbi:hypothetical protein HYW75_06405 [Candidatus Pacearchaeota archaeon]|nr:hypothetical protein [Candidatus Pacearchaeota archaeon]